MKLCDYCAQPAKLITGAQLYPHLPELRNKKFYRCDPCGAHVGCHVKDGTPLGRLANAELRRAKQNAHAAFDPIWKHGQMTRSQAYTWLSETLGIHPVSCHIGMFGLADCQRVIEACQARNERKQA